MDWDRQFVSYFSACVIDHGETCLSQTWSALTWVNYLPIWGEHMENIEMANRNIGNLGSA